MYRHLRIASDVLRREIQHDRIGDVRAEAKLQRPTIGKTIDDGIREPEIPRNGEAEMEAFETHLQPAALAGRTAAPNAVEAERARPPARRGQDIKGVPPPAEFER